MYVTSEAFGINRPGAGRLNAPAGLLLDGIVARAALPKVWQHEGRIGVRFTHMLMNGQQALDRAKSLATQNVAERSVVWRKTRMSQFSDVAPIEGSALDVTLRDALVSQPGTPDPMVGAREKYLAAIRQARLGA